MKMTLTKGLVSAALLTAAFAPLAVQAAPPQRHSPAGVNARLGYQNRRIEQGEHTGALTQRESRRLEARDARIKAQEYRARLSGDKFTLAERRRLEREENRTSSAIYKQKHDAQHRR